MNKKLWILSAILAATVVAAPAQAPFTNPRVVQELGLTPQQQQQLQDLTFKQARENLDLRHEKAIKELALRQEMAKETPNEAAVNKAIDDLSLVKARQAKVRFRHMQDMRAVLTPEQWQKVKAKLGNPKFTQNAAPHILEEHRQRLADWVAPPRHCSFPQRDSSSLPRTP